MVARELGSSTPDGLSVTNLPQNNNQARDELAGLSASGAG